MSVWAVKIDGKVYKQYRVTEKEHHILMGFPITTQTPEEWCDARRLPSELYAFEQIPLSFWQVENHEIVATEPDEEYKPSYMGGKK